MPDDARDLHRRDDLQHHAGLEGSIPDTDWTWEAFVNHGELHTFARQTGIYSLMRTRDGADRAELRPAASGTRATRNRAASALRPAPAPAASTSSTPPAGGFSEDCIEAIRADLKNRSKFRQTIAEANLQGGLFELPAGDVRCGGRRQLSRAGLRVPQRHADHPGPLVPRPGARHLPERRRLRLHRRQGSLRRAADPGAGATLPFFQELNLEVGGRMSDYSTTGTSWTYKALADWAVNDWLRFRGGYNRAERAPNIGELFLSAQQTFGVQLRRRPCSRPTRCRGRPTRPTPTRRQRGSGVPHPDGAVGQLRAPAAQYYAVGGPEPARHVRLRVPDARRQCGPGAGKGRHLDCRRR